MLLALLSLPAMALFAQDKQDVDDLNDPARGVAFEQRLGESLPLDARFVDEANKAVRLGDYFGERPVILVLAYYECPMLCTLVLNGMTKSLKTISFDTGKEYEVVVVSIDPGETPALAAEKKKNYVMSYGRTEAAAGWHFLTGKREDIRRVADAAGFRYRYDKKRDEYVHAAGLVIATPEGKLSRYFFGVEFAPRDLRLGLVEASDNEIGSLVDSVLLLCFHYDPALGKYGFVVSNALRIGGFATVLFLGLFVARSLLKERRRAQREGEA